ncbi:hypothetical protein SE17_04835 [Kouleothrix aurantiaca]|jgi:hypothetical protein|uniref:Uncharacterized protein n=1 Tax=Kouleothrix aurantiaca TaxID=186479 RepID=A0A0P9DF39_9CHLR|nr:hypothetical protein SE17_04835 [Kouleothrix aurantiaca]
MPDEKHIEGSMYHIRVKGNLDSKWADWFEGFVLTSQDDGETVLRGTVADQAALHGVLDRLNGLGLPLLLVALLDQLHAGRRCPLCGQPIAFRE